MNPRWHERISTKPGPPRLEHDDSDDARRHPPPPPPPWRSAAPMHHLLAWRQQLRNARLGAGSTDPLLAHDYGNEQHASVHAGIVRLESASHASTEPATHVANVADAAAARALHPLYQRDRALAATWRGPDADGVGARRDAVHSVDTVGRVQQAHRHAVDLAPITQRHGSDPHHHFVVHDYHQQSTAWVAADSHTAHYHDHRAPPPPPSAATIFPSRPLEAMRGGAAHDLYNAATARWPPGYLQPTESSVGEPHQGYRDRNVPDLHDVHDPAGHRQHAHKRSSARATSQRNVEHATSTAAHGPEFETRMWPRPHVPPLSPPRPPAAYSRASADSATRSTGDAMRPTYPYDTLAHPPRATGPVTSALHPGAHAILPPPWWWWAGHAAAPHAQGPAHGRIVKRNPNRLDDTSHSPAPPGPARALEHGPCHFDGGRGHGGRFDPAAAWRGGGGAWDADRARRDRPWYGAYSAPGAHAGPAWLRHPEPPWMHDVRAGPLAWPPVADRATRSTAVDEFAREWAVDEQVTWGARGGNEWRLHAHGSGEPRTRDRSGRTSVDAAAARRSLDEAALATRRTGRGGGGPGGGARDAAGMLATTRHAAHRHGERHAATVAAYAPWGHGDAVTVNGGRGEVDDDEIGEDADAGRVSGRLRGTGPRGSATVAAPTSSSMASTGGAPLPLRTDHWPLVTVRSRRRRSNLPAEARATLLAWVDGHCEHPFPTRAEKEGLMAATGLTLAQLETWFVNHRRRSLKKSSTAHPSTASPSVRDPTVPDG